MEEHKQELARQEYKRTNHHPPPDSCGSGLKKKKYSQER